MEVKFEKIQFRRNGNGEKMLLTNDVCGNVYLGDAIGKSRTTTCGIHHIQVQGNVGTSKRVQEIIRWFEKGKIQSDFGIFSHENLVPFIGYHIDSSANKFYLLTKLPGNVRTLKDVLIDAKKGYFELSSEVRLLCVIEIACAMKALLLYPKEMLAWRYSVDEIMFLQSDEFPRVQCFWYPKCLFPDLQSKCEGELLENLGFIFYSLISADYSKVNKADYFDSKFKKLGDFSTSALLESCLRPKRFEKLDVSRKKMQLRDIVLELALKVFRDCQIVEEMSGDYYRLKNNGNALKKLSQRSLFKLKIVAECMHPTKTDTHADYGFVIGRGHGSKRPMPEQALFWWIMSGNEKNACSQFNLGVYYQYKMVELFGLPNLKERGFYWTLESAKNDYQSGMINAASAFSNGLGTEKNPKEALFWWMKCSDSFNDNVAQHSLALAHFRGWGVNPDEAKALEYWKLASQNGNLKSKRVLALLYLKGDGAAPKDETKAIELYEECALKGVATAQNDLGYVYKMGFGGVKIDYKKACYWFEKAAAQNDFGGLVNYGQMKMNGLGCVIDMEKAVKLYKMAEMHKFECQFKDEVEIFGYYKKLEVRTKKYLKQKDRIEFLKMKMKQCSPNDAYCFYAPQVINFIKKMSK